MEETYPLKNQSCRISDQFRTSNWLAGMMMTVLRQYFGSEDRISLERARLLWKPDETQSQVQIDVVDNLKFTEAGKFPKILVDLENQGFPKDAIGDSDVYEQRKAVRNYTVRQESAFSIECWGLKKLEAFSISDEVRFFLMTYKREIASHYCLDYLRPIQVLKPIKHPMYDDYWIVRVIVEFAVQDNWGVETEALAVSAFNLSLTEG